MLVLTTTDNTSSLWGKKKQWEWGVSGHPAHCTPEAVGAGGWHLG